MKVKYQISKPVFICLLLNSICVGKAYPQEKQSLFFGQKTPGDTAVSFDVGVKFPEELKPSYLCFAPNGTECYFTVWGKKFAWVKIYLVKYKNGKYSNPVVVPFSMGYDTAGGFITKDGKKLYFNSKRDTVSTNYMDLFVVNKIDNTWGQAQILGSTLNSSYWDICYSEADNGTIVFSSNRPGGQGHDLYLAKKLPNETYTVENLTTLNSASTDYGSFISPDGSYIIFTSECKSKIGKSDLFISFLDANNEWTKPLNMEISGETYGINFKGKYQDSPYITSDGKYLFFNRNGIHWIRTNKIISQLRELALD